MGKNRDEKETAIHQVVELFSKGGIRDTVRLGQGEVYMFPSKSELGRYYVVARLTHNVWVCGCSSFRFRQRPEDHCYHIREILDQKGVKTV